MQLKDMWSEVNCNRGLDSLQVLCALEILLGRYCGEDPLCS